MVEGLQGGSDHANYFVTATIGLEDFVAGLAAGGGVHHWWRRGIRACILLGSALVPVLILLKTHGTFLLNPQHGKKTFFCEHTEQPRRKFEPLKNPENREQPRDPVRSPWLVVGNVVKKGEKLWMTVTHPKALGPSPDPAHQCPHRSTHTRERETWNTVSWACGWRCHCARLPQPATGAAQPNGPWGKRAWEKSLLQTETVLIWYTVIIFRATIFRQYTRKNREFPVFQISSTLSLGWGCFCSKKALNYAG